MSRNRYDRDDDTRPYYGSGTRGGRQDNARDEPPNDYDRGGVNYGRPPIPSRADEERDYGGGRGGGYEEDYRRGADAYEREQYDRARRSGNERGGYEGRREMRGPSRSHVRCRDIMTRDVTVATRDTSLQEVAQMMRDEDTGVIPVVERAGGELTAAEQIADGARTGRARVDNNGKLVGLITDRDIVVRALAEGSDARTVPAEEIMTADVHTARPNDRVIDVIRKMGDKQVRRIPVVDADGSLRGIISMADVALETEEDRELAGALEEISSGASFWSKIFG
ncbi:MAG: CBS domain-containing protein [Pyrinomonadaceae bacterium]